MTLFNATIATISPRPWEPGPKIDARKIVGVECVSENLSLVKMSNGDQHPVAMPANFIMQIVSNVGMVDVSRTMRTPPPDFETQ